jgi:two-component sensor histidine kinase
MENTLKPREQLQARTQAAAASSKKVVKTEKTPEGPQEDISEVIASFLEHVNKSADKGLWECKREFPSLGEEQLSRVAALMKEILSDVMVISYLGAKEIRISWQVSNEV